ncbi:HD domain-containing protein [Alkalibaculum sp. M08DMB]|uniref:HD domain-containing protein n=1 Tax=Alkalibaculum sporogenes TaxID=2655001 RepID=A0A6A7K8A4_9FIRM|nr:HD domain-containing protein [Alkalibaculum sporogenes]MPW25739.1 HD domain-containing protein [Alkalibaculum sporogenes]
MNNRILKDIEFIVEIDKMKSILRQTKIIGENRREDDAEHSWHIAVMAMILCEYANDKIDIGKVIKMVLIHDLVEIYAGDTFCYDKEGNLGKRDREIAAADKIYGMLQDDKRKELRALWDEFEEMNTPESLFAASMDRLQPMLNNYHSDGGTWKKYKVTRSQVYNRIAPVKKSSDQIWDYIKFMIEDAYAKGLLEK